MLRFLQILMCLVGLGGFGFFQSAMAAEGDLSAADLAESLASSLEDGDSATRLKMKIEPSGGGKKVVVQVQIKARRNKGNTQVVYQVLWPKSRKGEAFVIEQKKGGSVKGYAYVPPKSMTPLGKSKMKDTLLGSDLAYQDVVDNFFRWQQQSLVGNETVDRAECVILESKPGSGDSTVYGKVKTWVDTRRMVAMRVEKYDASGKLLRKIETTRVAKDDNKRYVPASLMVIRVGGGSVTEIEGSSIRHDVKFTDKDFTTESLNDFRVPR